MKDCYVILGNGAESSGPYYPEEAFKIMRESSYNEGVVVDSRMVVLARKFNPEKDERYN